MAGVRTLSLNLPLPRLFLFRSGFSVSMVQVPAPSPTFPGTPGSKAPNWRCFEFLAFGRLVDLEPVACKSGTWWNSLKWSFCLRVAVEQEKAR